MNINIQKEFFENFYCVHFTSNVAQAQVFFWFFENKVTIEDFHVFEKRHGYGKALFEHILDFLKQSNVKYVSIISRDSEEAYGFWSNVTGLNYSQTQHEHKIHVEKNLLLLQQKSSLSTTLKI